MEINLVPKAMQTQRVTARMVQSAQLLQMGTVELAAHLAEVLLENPVLEAGAVEAQDEAQPPQPVRTLEWMDAQDWQNHHYHRADYDHAHEPGDHGASAQQWREDTLGAHLTGQIAPNMFSTPFERAVHIIIDQLDTRGYFQESLAALGASYGMDEALLRRALGAVQRMEPAGVGARNVVECLLLQLKRADETGLPMTIVKQHLQDMCHDRYNAIAKKTGATREAVYAACRVIRGLNPKPGASFRTGEATQYVVPDILVTRGDGMPAVMLLRGRVPELTVSFYYQSLLKQTEDAELKAYLREKLQQAQSVVQGVAQRSSTLLACAECIAGRQRAFFQGGASHLAPLSLADVAQGVGLHESTVSRAVKDKWLQCDFGVFPLGYFFSRSVGGEDEAVSSDRVKAMLLEMIAGEDKQKPLSDEKLASMLAGASIVISRRTVAKYRGELGIPSTAGRRAF